MEVKEEYHSLIWDYIEKDVRVAINAYQVESSGSPDHLTNEDIEKILVDAVFEETASTVNIDAIGLI